MSRTKLKCATASKTDTLAPSGEPLAANRFLCPKGETAKQFSGNTTQRQQSSPPKFAQRGAICASSVPNCNSCTAQCNCCLGLFCKRRPTAALQTLQTLAAAAAAAASVSLPAGLPTDRQLESKTVLYRRLVVLLAQFGRSISFDNRQLGLNKQPVHPNAGNSRAPKVDP